VTLKRACNKDTTIDLKTQEVVLPTEKVSLEARESKYQQKGSLIWLTGFSGAGKTTLANQLERTLFDHDKLVYVLDGDKVRAGLNSDLGFSNEERFENIRRIGEVARLFADAGLIAIVACISPFRKERDSVRMAMAPGRFIEVFVDSPLEVCEARDPKGLYKKARKGIIKDFTGISSPYEPPLLPEVHLRTNKETIDKSVDKVLQYLTSLSDILGKSP
jgi:adenylyl-sulfate kinase